MNTIQNTTSTMSIVRKAIVLLTIATTLVGASFIGSPAVSAREGSLSTKDGCYIWIGNVMRFKRPGVAGELSVNDQTVALNIRLGLLLFALKPAIEREIHRFFDENFPS